ncbi:MAG: class GN sortase [bacterium]
MKTRVRKYMAAALLIVGLLMIGKGSYIYAKAWLAQQLLEVSWVSRQQGTEESRPWPWADASPIARLKVPQLEVDQIVLSNASGRSLAFGPGYVVGTAPPGQHGTTAISGHRDTHFDWLRDVERGQQVELVIPGGELRQYEVVQTIVVHQDDTGVLEMDNSDRLVLLTCYPFDSMVSGSEYRYAVSAVRKF